MILGQYHLTIAWKYPTATFPIFFRVSKKSWANIHMFNVISGDSSVIGQIFLPNCNEISVRNIRNNITCNINCLGLMFTVCYNETANSSITIFQISATVIQIVLGQYPFIKYVLLAAIQIILGQHSFPITMKCLDAICQITLWVIGMI
jgi:hypothetical protein